jgi:hypothetical protein
MTVVAIETSTRAGAEEISHLSEHALPLVSRGGRDAARGRDPVDDRLAGEHALLEKCALVELAEERAVVLVAPRRPRPPPPDERVDRGEARIGLVPQVPDERDPPARSNDAVQLRQRLVRAEPVERLPDRRGVDRRVRERDRLGRARERFDVRQNPLEHAAHLVAGLDGDDLHAERQQPPRELARAGAEVEHPRSRAEAEPLGDPADRLVGVRGPAALVDLRDGLEAVTALLLRHATTGRGR